MRFPKPLKKAMAYLGVPLLFASIGYLVLYIAGTPIWNPVSDIVSMISRENTDNIGFDAPTTDLFADSQPVEEGETIPASQIVFPTYGDRYGQVIIEKAGVEVDMYFGDSDRELRNGVGHYNGSSFPGCGSTVLVGGHNNAHFNGLKNVEVGDVITLKTHYATYTYTVTKTAVMNAKDDKAYDLLAKEENLVLYTCYPFDMLGLTPKRYFVYAEYTSGPRVLLDR